MREHWRRNGPPLNVAAVAIAAALGVDLIDREISSVPSEILAPRDLPSVAELQAIMDVKSGQDTREASLAIARRLGVTILP
jgi:hypothetical protein